jgi:ATP-binding cassette subfamily B (MDR/TAP) protein 1
MPDSAANPTAETGLPLKGLLFLGLVICIISRAMTPLFSLQFSRLLFEVSTGSTHIAYIHQYSLVILSVIAVDGLLMFLKDIVVQASTVAWITQLRTTSFAQIMAQDKKWFDKGSKPHPDAHLGWRH